MARVPYADTDKLEGRAAEAFSSVPPLNIFRMMAHAGPVFGRFLQFGQGILSETELDPELRELAILRVGHLSGAKYEVFQHERISRDMGMREELIVAAGTGSAEGLSDAETMVLRFTDDVVKNVRASDGTFEPLKEKLGIRQLQELTLTIGFYMLVSRYLETFGVDIEADDHPGTPQVRGR